MKRSSISTRATEKRRGLLVAALALLPAGISAAAAVSCTDRQPLELQVGAFRVALVPGQDLGTPEQPLDFSATETHTFRLDIAALRNDAPDEVDRTFDGYAVIAVRPTGETVVRPLSVRFKAGEARDVAVAIRKTYGKIRLVAVDAGYVPAADPGKAACNNGRDDDGDGFVDSPGDRGCYSGDDDSESGGVGAAGVSAPIYFSNPRIADVQEPILGTGGDRSPLVEQRVTIDRGWMVVTRVGVDGMYVTDFEGVRLQGSSFVIGDPLDLSYRSIFVFNFSTPLNLQEGDCLVQLDGVVDEFYGFTELTKPTWKKGDYAYCAAQARLAGASVADCPASDADAAAAQRCRGLVAELGNRPVDMTKMVIDDAMGQRSVWDPTLLDTERFEAALVQLSNVTVFKELVSCDVNGNKVIDYHIEAEKSCANACGTKVDCVVEETYNRYRQWTVHFTDGMGQLREVSIASAGALPAFDPVKAQGKHVQKIVGTLRNLSFARPAWILEPRRAGDCEGCSD